MSNKRTFLFTKHEEFRMFALRMAIDSKPIHFAKDEQNLADLVVGDAKVYFDFLVGDAEATVDE